MFSTEDARSFVERYKTAWASHDLALITALASNDGTWTIPGEPDPPLGLDEFKGWVERFFTMVPDVTLDIVSFFVSLDERRIAIEWQLKGTMLGGFDPPGFAPTGTVITDHGVDLLTLDTDGRITDWHMVFNIFEVAQQIGAVPRPGSFAERMGLMMQRRTARKLRRRAGREQSRDQL